MKNIKRMPFFLLIIVFLAAGNNSNAQEKENRGKAASEMKKTAGQEKQKGTEKVTEAEEAVETEAEEAREATEGNAEEAGEAIEENVEKAGKSSGNETKKVKDAAEREKREKKFKEVREKDGDKGQGQGHAYGKNKGDLQGRDFGQARAEQARMQQQTKEAELDSNLVKGEERVAQSREKIRVAREDLEKEKAGRRISEKDYLLKKEKIDNAEKAVDELDQKVRNGRSLKGDK